MLQFNSLNRRKSAAEGSFFWASEQSCADGCRVQQAPELTPRWSGTGQLGAGTKEEEEGEEKGEEALGSDRLLA